MSHQARIANCGLWIIILAFTLCAAQPWDKDSAQWTIQDAQRILANSPWAQAATASLAGADTEEPPPPGPLPGAPQAGMAGSSGVPDGRWDGGVGRLPTTGGPAIPVTIRWDSAQPVRLALSRLETEREAGSPAYTPPQADQDYIITVIGLVPAGRYKGAGQLETRSHSDETADAQDPEQMLEGLMAQSRLMPRNAKAIRPEDVKLDAATGTLHLFFPRSEVIDLKNKDVTFATRFGSMIIQKQFRLKEMIYQRKLAL